MFGRISNNIPENDVGVCRNIEISISYFYFYYIVAYFTNLYNCNYNCTNLQVVDRVIRLYKVFGNEFIRCVNRYMVFLGVFYFTGPKLRRALRAIRS